MGQTLADPERVEITYRGTDFSRNAVRGSRNGLVAADTREAAHRLCQQNSESGGPWSRSRSV